MGSPSAANLSLCNVCGVHLAPPVYVGPDAKSITSLCELRPGRTEVSFCEACGHVQTIPLLDIDDYYESQYRILLESEEEDQLYQIKDGKKVFRIEHQVRTFLNKVRLPKGAQVLDYGCAKGASARKLMQLAPDVSVNLFDVSSMYKPFWSQFTSEANWATHDVRPSWRNSFDAVMSFYVFEHIADPVASLKNAASLLKPNGILYWLIPNFITNPADFIVADHINHFSQRSIETAVRRAGLTLREIDGESHEAAWIVIASREAEPRSELRQNTSEKDLPEQVAMLSRYWTDIETRIRDFEAAHGDSHASIYGSGFYGTFIASRLANFDRISHFIDQNPFRQGRMLLNKPIVAPEQLPEDVQTIYVGLNMQSARAAIADVKCFGRRQLEFLFL